MKFGTGAARFRQEPRDFFFFGKTTNMFVGSVRSKGNSIWITNSILFWHVNCTFAVFSFFICKVYHIYHRHWASLASC